MTFCSRNRTLSVSSTVTSLRIGKQSLQRQTSRLMQIAEIREIVDANEYVGILERRELFVHIKRQLLQTVMADGTDYR